ncbi:universal stress protein [Streptomyces orinoci]|uniref:Universal stress protein n=1 Tax=Streptomyces orinoci TaxID=67339 RepID=A0ABV3JQZ4_STRON|nr:universal stress protein [Streptomyces orinoci]
MTRPVSAGVDGSPESLAAAVWAGREAVLRRVPLHLVYAGGADPDGGEWAAARIEAVWQELGTTHPGLPVEVRQESGAPTEVLLAEAATADLLVLGSRALAGQQGFLLGPVSLAVLARAPGPVTVVHEPEVPAAPATGRPVLVGLDPEEADESLLPFAFAAAARHDALLRVVRVRREEPNGGRVSRDAEALAEMLRPHREHWPAVEVDEWLLTGSPAQHLLTAAADAELLVVGRHEHRPALGVGPVAHAVLHHARCPVAVVPHD